MAKKHFKGLAKDFISSMKLQFIGKGADPNEIFVQDLFNYETPKTGNSVFASLMKNKVSHAQSLSPENRKILETVLQVYNEHIETKRDVLNQARQLFDTDIVQTVVDVMIDDGFNSFNNEKEEFRIEYDLSEEDKEVLGEEFQEQVQNVIDEFVEKFGIKSKVAELVPELLRDGEYALGVLFKENEGITEVIDDMDVIDLLPFYVNNELSFVINQPQYDNKTTGKVDIINNAAGKPPAIYKPDNIVFFRLKGPTKKRINMSAFYNNEFRKLFLEKTGVRLPKYIRMALPIYASAMKTLNRLQLMENVSTVLDLSDVLKPEIVTVTVPSNTNAQEAQQIVRDYERNLNDAGGLSDTDSLDIATLATQANRRKVLPQWLDSKGTITSTGLGQQAKSAGAWESISKLRNLIALSIGIPPFYLNLNENPIDKAQIIKLYSRYTRKLTSLQKTLADGVKDLIMIHCTKKGLNISKDNLVVKFKAITSGDALDDTDMMVATVSGINDLYKGIEEITSSENNNLVIDDQQFKELFDSLTSKYLNISNLIKISDTKFDDKEFGMEDGGFEDLGSPSGRSISSPSTGPSDFEDLEPSSPASNSIDNQNNAAYQDFANADDGIELEEPETITAEG